jgi:RHS repeat-associated protein
MNLTEKALSGVLTDPFQYTACEADAETGLYYYRARYYDPMSGRFLSEDPIGLSGGDVDLYAYVWNDPTTLVDQLGLQGGPWHPPAGVPTKCRPTDDCPTIKGKIWMLQRMIVSVTGWDWNVPSPRGGGRHSLPKDPNNPNNNDIAQLWKQLAECQALFAEKCTSCDPPVGAPVDVPTWKRFWQRNRTPILVTGAVAAGVAAVALAPVTGGQSLWGLAWAF